MTGSAETKVKQNVVSDGSNVLVFNPHHPTTIRLVSTDLLIFLLLIMVYVLTTFSDFLHAIFAAI